MSKYKLLKSYENFKIGDFMEIADYQLPYFRGMGFIELTGKSVDKEVEVKSTKIENPQKDKLDPSK